MIKIAILITLFCFMTTNAQNIKRIKSGDVMLHVKEYSITKDEAVILLHGGPGVPDDMIEVVNSLRRQYRVITFDQRGVGQSCCEDCNYTMQEYISDIEAIASYFKLDSFHLFGHSWGGLYAQIYAKEQPEKIRSLFLCSPGSGTNELWEKTEKEVMQFNKKTSSAGEWLRMGWNSLLGILGSNKAYRKMFKQVLHNYHKGYGIIKIESEQLQKIFAEPVNKTRKEIIRYKELCNFQNPQFPITITYGDNDIYGVSKSALLDRFPTAQKIIINKCGHIPWKHNPLRFHEILVDHYNIR